jgi:hypothetical protein
MVQYFKGVIIQINRLENRQTDQNSGCDQSSKPKEVQESAKPGDNFVWRHFLSKSVGSDHYGRDQKDRSKEDEPR